MMHPIAVYCTLHGLVVCLHGNAPGRYRIKLLRDDSEWQLQVEDENFAWSRQRGTFRRAYTEINWRDVPDVVLDSLTQVAVDEFLDRVGAE